MKDVEAVWKVKILRFPLVNGSPNSKIFGGFGKYAQRRNIKCV